MRFLSLLGEKREEKLAKGGAEGKKNKLKAGSLRRGGSFVFPSWVLKEIQNFTLNADQKIRAFSITLPSEGGKGMEPCGWA